MSSQESNPQTQIGESQQSTQNKFNDPENQLKESQSKLMEALVSKFLIDAVEQQANLPDQFIGVADEEVKVNNKFHKLN